MTARVLVTNDDGIDSPGIRWLARAAAQAGRDVVVAAPDTEYSGMSAALTAVQEGGRVVAKRRDLDGRAAYAVAASPAWIVLMAINGAFGERPDVVLSGVNRGANAGRAVLHSGTVGAALTAAAGGVRAMAVSLDVPDAADGSRHWATAAGIALDLLPVLTAADAGTVLNVNAPDLPRGRLRGVRRATLARFGRTRMAIVESDEGFIRTSVEASDEEREAGSDLALLSAGYASVTPVRAVGEASDVDLPGVEDG
jgi:5'-nucleotidase